MNASTDTAEHRTACRAAERVLPQFGKREMRVRVVCCNVRRIVCCITETFFSGFAKRLLCNITNKALSAFCCNVRKAFHRRFFCCSSDYAADDAASERFIWSNALLIQLITALTGCVNA